MTVRPRYTLRAKARDFHELAVAALAQASILIGFVRPYAQFIIAVVRGRTVEIITSRYTDPQEPR